MIEIKPNIKQFFLEENLCKQNVYKTSKKYDVVYINEQLYEQLFGEKFVWSKAKKKISEMFSITLNPKDKEEFCGYAYSDKQTDPLGLALSGNLGSGRAFFYLNKFNIKGDKTKLATSKNSNYSNGKFALSPAIKESILSNVLSEDYGTFKSLAILVCDDEFEFHDQYLDLNDELQENVFLLPCALEVRVYENKELYRLSNKLINKDSLFKEELINYTKKIAKLEAKKFCDRFLHGSWSVGNISTEANLIDFDTSTFVEGRFPQYSNTDKYKASYFGYEILGQKIMLNAIADFYNLQSMKKQISDTIDKTYIKELKLGFCKLIGLTQEIYEKYKNEVDSLFDKFNKLSRLFLPNYYELKFNTDYNNQTYIFNFSNFFQKYLIVKDNNSNLKLLFGLKLLLNYAKSITYEKVGRIEKIVKEHFGENIINIKEYDKISLEGFNFVKEYDSLFEKISKEYNINEIKFKQYIINNNRVYIDGNSALYDKLTNYYSNNILTNKQISAVINSIILANNRDVREENIINVKIYKDCIFKCVLCKDCYYYVIKPLKNSIKFVKIYSDNMEIMMSYSKEKNCFVSKEIKLTELEDIKNKNITIKANGIKLIDDIF